MKVLIDVNHPAHVHFFRHPIRLLREQGHEVLVTSREKEMTIGLLDIFGIKHIKLSSQRKNGWFRLGHELIERDVALFRIVRQFRPAIMASIGGTFIAHVGKLTGIPSLVFYDTENATIQNMITYPLASCVIVPRCYEAWIPKKRHIRYAGYHELSYLHPDYFSPNKDIAVENGLDEHRDCYLIRLVSWQSNHDVGERGISPSLLRAFVEKLQTQGKVIISSESQLPPELDKFRFRGGPTQIHHVMAFCRAFIGESATMASECSVLGVPSIYVAKTGRGYTNEQESRYGLVKNIPTLSLAQIEKDLEIIINAPISRWYEARQQLLADTIDVSRFVVKCITTYPEPLTHYQFKGTA